MEMVLKVLAVIFDIIFVIFTFYVVFIIGLRVYWNLKSKKLKGRELPYMEGPFQRLRKGKGLIYFSSPSCRPCKLVEPIIKKLSREFKNIHVIKVDVTKDSEKARTFGILATPSIIITDNGKIVEVLIGPVSEKDLREKLS